MGSRKVALFIASSLDGYIAGAGDDLNFLSAVDEPGEDYGYSDFTGEVDTVVMGRTTYEKVMSFGVPFPHESRTSYVVTSRPLAVTGNIRPFHGDPADLIGTLKMGEGKTIYVDGGGKVIHRLLEEGLIDEITVSIIPVLLGGGTPLFPMGFRKTSLSLLDCRSFRTGLVRLKYAVSDKGRSI